MNNLILRGSSLPTAISLFTNDLLDHHFTARLDFFIERYFYSLSQNYVLNLSFAEAVNGVNKDIRVRVQAKCKRCNGKRAEPGSTYVKCPQCNGTGEVSK